jgi:hypothetical protein
MNWKIVGIVLATFLGVVTLAQTRFPAKDNLGEVRVALSVSRLVQPRHQCDDTGAKQGVLWAFTAPELLLAAQDACSDPIDKCSDPVKYLGSNGDCACFACEYGRPTQHNVCTKNESDKKKLSQRAGAQ